MAQQERAIRTRKIILEAAAQIFDERGYESTTIADILERADVTKGALYFHFPSKGDLARGVLAAAVTTEGVRPHVIKLQELVDIVLLLAYRLPREPTLSAALRMATDLQSRRQFGTRWADWAELLTGFLKEAKEREELRPGVDEEQTARMLVCCWTGVQVVTEGLPESYDLPTEIASLLRFILPSIVAPDILSRLEVSAERAVHLYDDMPAWRAETRDTAPVGLAP